MRPFSRRSPFRPVQVLSLAVLVALGAYALLVLGLWRFQERIVFQPPRVDRGQVTAEHTFALGATPVRQVSYRARDGWPLFAYLVGDPARSAELLIAFHGNADLARNLLPWAVEAVRLTGAAVLLPEYRGYDGLTGPPTYHGIADDARAALAVAHDALHVPENRIVLFGHSLGSAVATELAADAGARSLVLQSPFSSAREMARRMAVPGLSMLWRLVARVHYNTEIRVRQLQMPVWVAHGDRDLIVPVRMGRSVYEAATVKGGLLIVHGAGHNDVPDRGGRAYWEWMRRAVGRRVPGDG